MMLGGKLVLETVDNILAGSVHPIPQEQLLQGVDALRPAPKIFKETCRIDWNQPLKRIYDFIRGLSPYPAAWSELNQADGTKVALKIYETEKNFVEHHLPIGTVCSDGKTFFKVAVNDGYLSIKELQLAGKKRLRIEEFLRGYKVNDSLTVM